MIDFTFLFLLFKKICYLISYNCIKYRGSIYNVLFNLIFLLALLTCNAIYFVKKERKERRSINYLLVLKN